MPTSTAKPLPALVRVLAESLTCLGASYAGVPLGAVGVPWPEDPIDPVREEDDDAAR